MALMESTKAPASLTARPICWILGCEMNKDGACGTRRWDLDDVRQG
jgi:hypothetical protein